MNQDDHSLSEQLLEKFAEVVRSENERLLQEHLSLKPLMSITDVARTLNVSPRTVENLIALGEIRPLWIKGQRRFHPDSISAYLRHIERKKR